MSAEIQTNDVPHPRYTETKRASYGSQQEVAEAWSDGLYPTHTGGELYSSSNFKGRQNNDGTGVLRHYRTREAIRTRNGLTLNNAQCWSRGFAHCSPPRNSDATVPLSAVESETDYDHNAYDITAVQDGEDMTIVEIDGGAYGVAFGRDWSIINGPANFIFRLTADELEQYTPDTVTELLTPAEVRESDMPVVESHEYTKFRLDKDEAESHREAGGMVEERTVLKGTEWERQEYKNHQQFRADLQGNVIVRQGEWFLIPVDGVPVSFGDGVPFECNGCGGTSFDVDARRAVCKSCGYQHRTPGDYDQEIGNHLPSEGVYVDGVQYARGVVRHFGNDHNAVRLGDTWHMAVTHDRDVTVYDSGNGGSRGD